MHAVHAVFGEKDIEERCQTFFKTVGKNNKSSAIKRYQSLTVFYKSADNLISKRNKLYYLITSVKPEIICITEILPKNAFLPVDDCELQIQGLI